jgi:hypothetical protein
VDRSEKAREKRLRRLAASQGYRLDKSRRQDWRAADCGAYWLVCAETDILATWEAGISLDEVEAWLTS